MGKARIRKYAGSSNKPPTPSRPYRYSRGCIDWPRFYDGSLYHEFAYVRHVDAGDELGKITSVVFEEQWWAFVEWEDVIAKMLIVNLLPAKTNETMRVYSVEDERHDEKVDAA